MEPTGRTGVPLPARRLPDWVDLIIGAAAVVVSVVVARAAHVDAIDPRLEPPSLVALVLTAVSAAGISLWRRRPLTGLLVIASAATAVSAAGYYIGALPVVLLLGLCALAANGTRRQALTGLTLTAVAFVGLRLAEVPDLTSGNALSSIGLSALAVAVGEVVRLRRAHQQGLVRSAEARGQVVAERAVVEERLRIARELHDVVAHSMSLIAVQAGVGAHVLRTDPAAAERALEVIADTSRDALTQTRSVVGLLRTGDDAQPSLPGLASLESLVDGVRGAGLRVDVTVFGDVRDLPAVVDLAAYRVVQESLTNAVKHATGCPVSVRLVYEPEELLIDVSNTHSPAPTPRPRAEHPGFGLVGLRERARALGGRLDAGPSVDGGFRVVAHLPTTRPLGAIA